MYRRRIYLGLVLIVAIPGCSTGAADSPSHEVSAGCQAVVHRTVTSQDSQRQEQVGLGLGFGRDLQVVPSSVFVEPEKLGLRNEKGDQLEFEILATNSTLTLLRITPPQARTCSWTARHTVQGEAVSMHALSLLRKFPNGPPMKSWNSTQVIDVPARGPFLVKHPFSKSIYGAPVISVSGNLLGILVGRREDNAHQRAVVESADRLRGLCTEAGVDCHVDWGD